MVVIIMPVLADIAVLVPVDRVVAAHGGVSAMVRFGAGRFRRWAQRGASHDGRVKGFIRAQLRPISALTFPWWETAPWVLSRFRAARIGGQA